MVINRELMMTNAAIDCRSEVKTFSKKKYIA